MFSQLCEGFNVTHKDDEGKDTPVYGRGRVVGFSERVKYDENSKKEIRKFYAMTIWEEARDVSPSFHEPSELINSEDFDNYETSEDDDDYEDDENENDDGEENDDD